MLKDREPMVLIVDDDASTCDILQENLCPSYRCEIAHTVRAARKLLADGLNPDVILLDLRFPESSGEALLSEVDVGRTAVVAFTGVKDLHQAVRVMANGAFHYLTKDQSPDEVLEVVHRAAKAARARRSACTLDEMLHKVSGEMETFRKSLSEEVWQVLVADRIRRMEGDIPLKDYIEEFEKRLIQGTLKRHGENRVRTARALGIHVNTLLLKIRRHRLGTGE